MSGEHAVRCLIGLLAAFLVGCPALPLDPAAPYAHVVYDPGSGSIPLPNDALRDADAGRLDLDTTKPGLTPTEVDARSFLNTLDGWSSVSTVSASLSEPADPGSLPGNVSVWEWGADPRPILDGTLTLDADGLGLSLLPPRSGWARGGTYVVAVRGGPDGLRTPDGRPFGHDAAFQYLRLEQRLDSPANQRAFSGATRAERLDKAASMEALRVQIAPFVQWFDAEAAPADRIPRDQLAALWSFTVTRRVELAMDPDSQRVPLPFDLLIDPDTGLVDLPPADDDEGLVVDAKIEASKLDGFGVSADLFFELTGPVDPSTLADSIQLVDVSQTATSVPIVVRAMAESGSAPCSADPIDDACRHIVIELTPEALPLATDRTYAVVVRDTLLDASGEPVLPMLMGHLLRGREPIAVDGASRLASLDTADALRLETLRSSIAPSLDSGGRDDVTAAWPFTTLQPEPLLAATVNLAETSGVAGTPTVLSRKPIWTLIGDNALRDLFPGALNPGPDVYSLRTLGVGEVIQGTLPLPYFLDPETRRWRAEDAFDVEDVHFLATVPEDAVAGPLKVVIFGHAVVTDRRFLMTIAGRLAQKGYAAVAIDFPFHGVRTACVDASLVSVPNFFPQELQDLTGLTDNLLYFPPCESGADATCSDTGECLDGFGQPEPFASFPIMDVYPAGGAAFLDVHDIAHIPDHFRQALSDLGGLRRSLETQDWASVFDQPIDTTSFHYAGQSLGAIIGSVYVAMDPAIDRAVLNVPGSNMVDLFRDSTFFGSQVSALLEDLDVEPGTFEETRLMAIASWLVDAVDPHSVAHRYRDDQRAALIQMDKVAEGLGDMVIPNHTTESLQRASGLPMIAYPSVLHGDLVIPVVGNAMLDDLADFLAGEAVP